MADIKIEDIVDPLKPEVAAIRLEKDAVYLILVDDDQVPYSNIRGLLEALSSCGIVSQWIGVKDPQRSIAIFKLKKEQ